MSSICVIMCKVYLFFFNLEWSGYFINFSRHFVLWVSRMQKVVIWFVIGKSERHFWFFLITSNCTLEILYANVFAVSRQRLCSSFCFLSKIFLSFSAPCSSNIFSHFRELWEHSPFLAVLIKFTHSL